MSARPALRGAERQADQPADRHGQGEAVYPGESAARAGGEEDVPGPHDRGAQREGGTGEVEAVHPGAPEQGDTGQSQRRPEPVDYPAAGGYRQRQRPEHLQRDRCAERDARDGLIEQHVHRRRRHAVGADQGPVRPAPAPDAGPGHGQQQCAGDRQPQRRHAGRSHPGKELDGAGRADLLGEQRGQHQRYRAGPSSPVAVGKAARGPHRDGTGVHIGHATDATKDGIRL